MQSVQHTSCCDPDTPASSAAPQLASPVTTTVESQLYQCPLHCWSASGTRREADGDIQSCFWLYVEYRSRSGAAIYSQFRFYRWQALTEFLTRELPTASLHDIAPEQTRLRPIG